VSAEAAAAHAGPEAAVRRDWLLLALTTISFGFGFGIVMGITPSFTAGYLHLGKESLGQLEAMREVPGLLTAGMMGLLAAIALPRLAVLALLVLGVGIAAQGHAGSFWPLVACNVVWSAGLHVWLTVQPSLTLSLSRAGHHGHGLGMMNRYSSLAMMAGLGCAAIVGPRVGYGWIFGVAGAVAASGGIFAARITRAAKSGAAAPRLVFRPRYWRYYGLMLLDGGRRQIVQTFVLLILVREFHVPTAQIALLVLVNGALTMLAAPVVGRWTDRFGERRVLGAYYALVAVVFFLYTQVGGLAAALHLAPVMLFVPVFVVDNLLFTASVGIQTYIRHSAPPEELAPSLAMGLTWNHVAAVTVPLFAGFIWERYGYQRIFLYGIGLALASLAMCRTLPYHQQEA
jgi:predicted MFS family arabinose efflux permease